MLQIKPPRILHWKTCSLNVLHIHDTAGNRRRPTAWSVVPWFKDSWASVHSKHVLECLCMTEKRCVRERSSINLRTGQWMVITAEGRSVLHIDLPLPFLGHSSRMAILHFYWQSNPHSGAINLHQSVRVCVFIRFFIVCACLYGCVRLSSPRFPE